MNSDDDFLTYLLLGLITSKISQSTKLQAKYSGAFLTRLVRFGASVYTVKSKITAKLTTVA